ncbi:amino acid adenylation domain-containing protein [Paenibacillus sp. FSL K6-1230]|uniref:amino acid adenylation domain-containing protein n=1 Tax=Paenibacillus sp. FSL K6-1230 TaxID=2921603 RepID=UPI0003A8D9A6
MAQIPATSNNPFVDNASKLCAELEVSLLELLALQVESHPERIAVQFQGSMMTYRELDEASEHMAHALLQSGVNPADLVGIWTRRGPEMLIAMLGVMKSGAAFLPIDAQLPPARVAYMLDNAQAPFLLMDEGFPNVDELRADAIILHYREMEQLEARSASNCPNCPGTAQAPEELAYVMYTSGSTGLPKGVMITRQGLLNFILDFRAAIDFEHLDTFLCLAPMSFDIFMVETILPLTMGKRVIIAEDRHRQNPLLLGRLIAEEQIDFIQMTPSAMSMLLGFERVREHIRQVKMILVGGEPFPLPLLRQLQELTEATIYNVYGPTEGTVWVAAGNLTNAEEIHIGAFLRHTEPLILDEHGKSIEDGHTGELYITGECLARGYIQNAEETAARFLVYEYQQKQLRVYKTGDLVRRQADGNLCFVGRVDHQIKLKGRRIEPEEIERAMLLHPLVTHAVSGVDDQAHTPFLFALYISQELVSGEQWRAFLKDKLPHYMIPRSFHRADALPLNHNGKVDRKQLKGAGYRVYCSHEVENT